MTDIAQQKYKKLIVLFRGGLTNVINQYPISREEGENQLPNIRNLKYIIQKQKYSNTMPFAFYAEFPQEIKQLLTDSNVQAKLYALRIVRCLPFHYRVKVIQENQNQLSMFVLRQPQLNNDKKTIGYNPVATPQFHYQLISDMVDFLLSVYQLTGLSQEIYFDVNQKITAIASHIIQKYSSSDRNVARNSYQALRYIFLVFSECKGRAGNKRKIIQNEIQTIQSLSKIPDSEHMVLMKSNRLINKLISILSKDHNYQLPTNSSTVMNSGNFQNYASNARLRQLIMKTRQYEIRVRCRMLTGICYLLTYIPQYLPELYELLTQQIFIILENANEFDINLECFLSIKAILALPLSHPLRSSLIKKWIQVLSQLSNSYKKEYFPFYIQISKEVCEYEFCPLRVKYFASTGFLQITKSIQQQLSRFIVYKFSCRNIMMITNYGCASQQNHSSTNRISSKNSFKKQHVEKSNNILINIFHYDWFVNRVKEQNDQFKSEFLICLLHAYFTYPNRLTLSNRSQIRDLLDLCHYMLVWSSNCREETHIPTVKFAFDFYLEYLKEAAERLGTEVQKYIIDLIQRCNGPTMSLLFKFKLIRTLIKLECYASIMTYSQTKLKLDFLEGQIELFMMPKNSKPIFDYEYSLTVDGQIESRKQIETIKVIMDLLSAIEQVYKNDSKIVEIVNNMVIRYHEYLTNLQLLKTSNKDLINCLQSLEADHYFTACQRNFLLSLIDEQDAKGNNIQYTLNDKIVFSPFQTFDSDEQYNIFGAMSPVHLKIRILGGRGYTSVYIQAKKSQWVGITDMKLIVSSAVQVKQVPFESCIVEIKIDRSGLINFQAWTTEGNPILLGSGSHRINRKFLWLQVNHLKIIDGIRCRGFLNRQQAQGDKQAANQKDETYLTYCFGQPVLLQIIFSRNEIVVTVNNKQVKNQIQELIWKMVEDLTNGTAQIIRPY